MKKLILKCYCHEGGMEFYFGDNFDATSIDTLYCPHCSEYAAYGSLLIRLHQAYDVEPGIWGIKFNDIVLKEQDKNFRKSSDYFINLFTSGKITFSFLKSPKDYEILGIAGETRALEAEIKKDIEKDARKKHKPKPIKKL